MIVRFFQVRGSYFDEKNNVDVQRNRETTGIDSTKLIEKRIMAEKEDISVILRKAMKGEFITDYLRPTTMIATPHFVSPQVRRLAKKTANC